MSAHTAREEFYRYSGTLKYMELYARECYQKISRHLGQPDRQPRWTELQNFYSLLSSKQEEPQVDIYKVITEHIDEYKQDVKDELLNLSNP